MIRWNLRSKKQRNWDSFSFPQKQGNIFSRIFADLELICSGKKRLFFHNFGQKIIKTVFFQPRRGAEQKLYNEEDPENEKTWSFSKKPNYQKKFWAGEQQIWNFAPKRSFFVSTSSKIINTFYFLRQAFKTFFFCKNTFFILWGNQINYLGGSVSFKVGLHKINRLFSFFDSGLEKNLYTPCEISFCSGGRMNKYSAWETRTCPTAQTDSMKHRQQ